MTDAPRPGGLPDERRDDLWAAYEASEVHVTVGDRTVTAVELAAELREPVYAVTGWNPMSEERPAEENAAANRALEAVLVEEGIRHWPAVGAAPDFSWSEEGFVVTDLSLEEAKALGRRFDQLAIFVADGEGMITVRCA